MKRSSKKTHILGSKMSGTRDGEITEKSGRIVMSNEKEGRLKNMWKKSYINRWIDSSSREGGSHSNTEADYAGNIDYARFVILPLHWQRLWFLWRLFSDHTVKNL